MSQNINTYTEVEVIRPKNKSQNEVKKINLGGKITTVFFLVFIGLFLGGLLEKDSTEKHNQLQAQAGEISTTAVYENKTVYQDDKTELPPESVKNETPAPAPAPAPTTPNNYSPILNFVNNYPGSRLKGDYINTLIQNCDYHTLKVVVAIATHETGQGKATTKNANFWGWFAGGNRQYDPDRNTMARVICAGISSYYPNLIVNGNVNRQQAVRYSGNDRPDTWVANVTWAFNQMK